MGSFAASVDVPEQLRPWAGAGLTHLYLPEGLDLALSSEVAERAENATITPDQRHELAEQSGSRATAEPRHQTQAAAGPRADSNTAPAMPPTASASGAAPAPQQWPEPWRGLAARVRSAPRVIITYSALADDVSGTADPVRRKLFLSVLAYLGWPQGTTLFWPISFPAGVDPGAAFASDIFAAGVRHFGIRHVLCFGTGAAQRARTLFPQDEKDVVVHAAPAPEALAALLPHELHQVLAGIKAINLP